jgi:hypothetical protein
MTSLLAVPGALAAVTIPPTVTSIAASACSGNQALTRITIPASVTSIGFSAFINCPALKTFLFLGHRPGIGSQPFTPSPTTIVFYLAGRIGWTGGDGLFGSLSTALLGLPSITAGPSDVVTTTGEDVAFEVTVDAGYPIPCRYQWRKNGLDLPGKTQPVLSLTDVQPGDAGQYTVRVSSDVGTVSGTARLSLEAGNLYTQSQYDAGVSLGFQLGSQAATDEILSDPNAFDLYSEEQIQTAHIGTPLLQRDAATGEFELTIEARKSTGLDDFSPLPFTLGDVTVSPEGKLLFRFSSPEGAAFFRVDAR